MDELTDKELQAVIYLVRARLRYEARRKSKVVGEGVDLQQLKVWQLKEIAEKLEGVLNNR